LIFIYNVFLKILCVLQADYFQAPTKRVGGPLSGLAGGLDAFSFQDAFPVT